MWKCISANSESNCTMRQSHNLAKNNDNKPVLMTLNTEEWERLKIYKLKRPIELGSPIMKIM